MNDAIQAYLEKNQDRFVEELCALIRFPSVSAQAERRADTEACARWLEAHCREIGLEARLEPTEGNPVVLARTPRSKAAKKRPHFLVYGHYDVQPAEPLELWKTPPFEPQVAQGRILGRGASDNKGQHLAHLKAIEAFLKTGTELPCDLTFVLEGEEEVGSASLAGFLKKNRSQLHCDAVVISDSGMPDLKHPALTYALRGIVALEIRLDGPSRDLHSGIHGGAVENPAMALCRILGQLKDARGRVKIPGFYDEVAPLSAFERRQLASLPFSEKGYQRFLGVPQLAGEAGYTSWERRTARPTLEINGLTSGYQGPGSKTIVPAWASAKLSIRLVPNQRPAHVLEVVRKELKRLCPPTVRMSLQAEHAGEPYLISPKGPLVQAALASLQAAFGRPPVLMREGGSIPIVNDFKKILGAETLLLGLALPDDNPHSPNEKFDLACFFGGMRMSAHLWPLLTAACQRR